MAWNDQRFNAQYEYLSNKLFIPEHPKQGRVWTHLNITVLPDYLQYLKKHLTKEEQLVLSEYQLQTFLLEIAMKPHPKGSIDDCTQRILEYIRQRQEFWVKKAGSEGELQKRHQAIEEYHRDMGIIAQSTQNLQSKYQEHEFQLECVGYSHKIPQDYVGCKQPLCKPSNLNKSTALNVTFLPSLISFALLETWDGDHLFYSFVLQDLLSYYKPLPRSAAHFAGGPWKYVQEANQPFAFNRELSLQKERDKEKERSLKQASEAMIMEFVSFLKHNGTLSCQFLSSHREFCMGVNFIRLIRAISQCISRQDQENAKIPQEYPQDASQMQNEINKHHSERLMELEAAQAIQGTLEKSQRGRYQGYIINQAQVEVPAKTEYLSSEKVNIQRQQFIQPQQSQLSNLQPQVVVPRRDQQAQLHSQAAIPSQEQWTHPQPEHLPELQPSAPENLLSQPLSKRCPDPNRATLSSTSIDLLKSEIFIRILEDHELAILKEQMSKPEIKQQLLGLGLRKNMQEMETEWGEQLLDLSNAVRTMGIYKYHSESEIEQMAKVYMEMLAHPENIQQKKYKIEGDEVPWSDQEYKTFLSKFLDFIDVPTNNRKIAMAMGKHIEPNHVKYVKGIYVRNMNIRIEYGEIGGGRKGEALESKQEFVKRDLENFNMKFFKRDVRKKTHVKSRRAKKKWRKSHDDQALSDSDY